jgi:hypothetical protein
MLTSPAVPITLTGTGSSFLANNLNFTSGSYDIDLHGTNEVVNVNGNLTGGVGSSAAAVQVEPGTANCAVTINGSATCLNTGNYDGALDVYGSANAVTVNGPVYANGTQSAGYGVYTNGSNLKIAVRGDVQWLGTNSATGCSAVRTDGATNSVYITGTVSSANTNAPTIGNTVASSSTLTMGGLVEVPNHPSSMGTNIFVATPVQGTVSVNGSSSGTAVFSEPWRGAARKEVVIQLANLNGTASWTYSMPFGATPVVVNSDAAVTSVSATSVTVTGSGTSRTILLEGN